LAFKAAIRAHPQGDVVLTSRHPAVSARFIVVTMFRILAPFATMDEAR